MSFLTRLYSFIFHRPFQFWFGTILMVLGLALGNVAPFFVKALTEAVQVNQIDWAFSLVIVFGIAAVISNLLDGLAYFITDKNMVGASTDISHAVLSHIHNLDFVYHTNKSSGKLISLMKRGDDAFFTYYDILNRQFLGIIVSFSIMFVAFLQLRPHYIIFLVGLMLLTIFISQFLVKINIAKKIKFNLADDEISSVRVDNLVNFDTVKYFANEVFEQNKFQKLLTTWDKSLQNYFFTFRYFDTIIGNLINLALVGILFIGLRDLQLGQISFADFLLITTFSMTLFPKMMQLLYSIRELAKKYTDLTNYLDLLDEKIEVSEPANPVNLIKPNGEVYFQHVSFAYDTKKDPILSDFDLKIAPGEVIALVGYSGAGKTTIGKLLMRMYDPTEGKITIDNINVADLAKNRLRTLVGIVPQDPLLFNNTIFYNIAYAKHTASKAQVLAAASAAKVDEFVAKLAKGYDTVVGERGIKLSGGQRQRLAIARVLLEQPKILILDEATSALDSVSEQTIQTEFWNLVRDPENPRTSIIIAHRLSTIMKADRIIVMDKGKIAEVGTHTELLKKPTGIYYRLWSLQKGGFIADGEGEPET